MMRSPSISLLAAGLFALATGCSSPQDSSAPAAAAETAAPTVAAVRGPGERADSLNGIPGHQLGEPLSAFPGLKLSTDQTPGCKTYVYPGGKGEPGWFGKRAKASPGMYYSFYKFRDGRFVAFSAAAYREGRTALLEQAAYLFGPGVPRIGGINWEGKRVFASTSDETNPVGGPYTILEVQSMDFVRALAKDKADQLKAENAL